MIVILDLMSNKQEALHAACRLFHDVTIAFLTPPLSTRANFKGDRGTSVILDNL